MTNLKRPTQSNAALIACYGNMARYHAIIALLPKTFAASYAAHLRGERVPARRFAAARRAIVADVAGDYTDLFTVFSDGSAIRSYLNHDGHRVYNACLSCLDAGCDYLPGVPADVVRKGLEVEASLPSVGVHNLTPLAQRLLALAKEAV